MTVTLTFPLPISSLPPLISHSYSQSSFAAKSIPREKSIFPHLNCPISHCQIKLREVEPHPTMGISLNGGSSSVSSSHYHVHKVFLLSNYLLLGAASSCIFLTLSLRLLPSICGLFLILLHIFTIAGAVSGCTAASSGTNRWYAAHMVFTVLTAIFQGSVSVLIFTRTGDFLQGLKSYVREEDGIVILRMAGGLCVLIFCLEWIVLVLAFVLRYYAFVEGDGVNSTAMKRSAKVQEEDKSDWPWPFQV